MPASNISGDRRDGVEKHVRYATKRGRQVPVKFNDKPPDFVNGAPAHDRNHAKLPQKVVGIAVKGTVTLEGLPGRVDAGMKKSLQRHDKIRPTTS